MKNDHSLRRICGHSFVNAPIKGKPQTSTNLWFSNYNLVSGASAPEIRFYPKYDFNNLLREVCLSRLIAFSLI
jgi:hypothetical protein